MRTKVQCSAVTKENNRCANKILFKSKYCWHHQDWKQIILGGTICGFVFSIILTFGTIWYQNKYPKVDVVCSSTENLCSIECLAKNSGRAVAENVTISFLHLLPVGTIVSSDRQEFGVRLEKNDNILNPNKFPEEAAGSKTFNVIIPTIPKKEEIKFEVFTNDQKNLAACGYLKHLDEIRKRVITSFGEELILNHPYKYTAWDNTKILAAYYKNSNIYKPEKVLYGEESREVIFITEKERSAYDFSLPLLENLFAEQKINALPKVDNLPVLSVETKNDGNVLYLIWPGYILFKFPPKIQPPLIQPDSYPTLE